MKLNDLFVCMWVQLFYYIDILYFDFCLSGLIEPKRKVFVASLSQQNLPQISFFMPSLSHSGLILSPRKRHFYVFDGFLRFFFVFSTLRSMSSTLNIAIEIILYCDLMGSGWSDIGREKLILLWWCTRCIVYFVVDFFCCHVVHLFNYVICHRFGVMFGCVCKCA